MCFRAKARTLETEVLCFLFVAGEGSQRANYMQPSKIIPLIPANATPATMPGAPAAWPRNAPTSFHVLGKPSGATCNLDCTYCFFLSKEKLYPDSRFRMTDDLLEAYIHQLIESQRGPEVTIAWQGGEPTLMGLDFYKRSIEYEKKYACPGTTIQHTMQTNGILLNDAWCEFFREGRLQCGELRWEVGSRRQGLGRPLLSRLPLADQTLVCVAARIQPTHD